MTFVGDFMFKMPPKHRAKVHASDLKCKKDVVCLMERICVLDKLHSGMSTAGHECKC